MSRGFELIGALALLLATETPSMAQEEAATPPAYYFDHVRISVEGGATPFLAVTYAVRNVDGLFIVLQTKQYPNVPSFDNRAAVALTDDALTLFRVLADNAALELPDAASDAPFSLAYRIDVAFEGKAHSFLVKGPELLSDMRYSRIVEAVTGLVEKYTGEAWFHDILAPDEQIGLLNMMTFPPADVELDGIPIGRRTPISGFEVIAGEHRAVITVPEKGIRKRIKFTAYGGQVTNLNINLD